MCATKQSAVLVCSGALWWPVFCRPRWPSSFPQIRHWQSRKSDLLSAWSQNPLRTSLACAWFPLRTRQGRGQKNEVFAYTLFDASAKAGNKVAVAQLNDLEKSMSPQDIRMGKELAGKWRQGTRLAHVLRSDVNK